jgi:MSHA biogenesis protein MshP
MFRERKRSVRRRGGGFAAVTAVFVVVVLGGLGAALVFFASTQQRSSAFDVEGTHVYQAARAGLEYGLYKALTASSCAASTNITPTGALARYGVNVACTATTHDEGGTTVTMYQITATACNRATCPAAVDASYVERQLRMVAGSPAP